MGLFSKLSEAARRLVGKGARKLTAEEDEEMAKKVLSAIKGEGGAGVSKIQGVFSKPPKPFTELRPPEGRVNPAGSGPVEPGK